MRSRLGKMAAEAVAATNQAFFSESVCVAFRHPRKWKSHLSPWAAKAAAAASELLRVVLHRLGALAGRLLVLWLCRCDAS